MSGKHKLEFFNSSFKIIFLQFTLAQVQSAASVKIELSINKTLTDFNKAIDKLNATTFKALNTEAVAFYLDVKNAIVSTVSTSTIVANVGVSATASSYFEAVAKVSAAITTSDSKIKEYINPELLVSRIATSIEDFKANLNVPISEIKEKVRVEIEANPKSQTCYEKALKNLTPLTAAVNKNITTSFTLAIKEFNANAKIYHGYIKANVTLLTKIVSSCISKKPQEAVLLCIDATVKEVDQVLAIISTAENDIVQLYVGFNVNASIKMQDISKTINDKKDEILMHITSCAPVQPSVKPITVATLAVARSSDHRI